VKTSTEVTKCSAYCTGIKKGKGLCWGSLRCEEDGEVYFLIHSELQKLSGIDACRLSPPHYLLKADPHLLLIMKEVFLKGKELFSSNASIVFQETILTDKLLTAISCWTVLNRHASS
jgi:hypothetical protein